MQLYSYICTLYTHHLVCIVLYFRYRNFRTFASPRPVQFACLALDPSSEVVSAGSLDTFEIFVWSMQTGKLLEVHIKTTSRNIKEMLLLLCICSCWQVMRGQWVVWCLAHCQPSWLPVHGTRPVNYGMCLRGKEILKHSITAQMVSLLVSSKVTDNMHPQILMYNISSLFNHCFSALVVVGAYWWWTWLFIRIS